MKPFLANQMKSTVLGFWGLRSGEVSFSTINLPSLHYVGTQLPECHPIFDTAKIALAATHTANSTLCHNLDSILAISPATEWYDNFPWTGLLHKSRIISVISYDIE